MKDTQKYKIIPLRGVPCASWNGPGYKDNSLFRSDYLKASVMEETLKEQDSVVHTVNVQLCFPPNAVVVLGLFQVKITIMMLKELRMS